MNLNQRAKIFLPFAALTGYEQSLERRLSEVEEKYEHKPPVHEIDDDFGF